MSFNSEPRKTKTYADVLMSSVLSTRLLITSGNGTLFSSFLYLFGMDKALADLLNRIVPLNYDGCYWLVYLLVIILVLSINIFILFLESRGCYSAPDDWFRVKEFIFKERPNYNFSTGKWEMTKSPLYYLLFIGLSIILGLIIAVDIIIYNPLKMYICKDYSEYLFKYSAGVLYGTFVISNIPPYLLVLIKILFSQTLFKFKQYIR
jgi:hypothetical protein